MFKKEVVFILASLIFLIGAGCEKAVVSGIAECDQIPQITRRGECRDAFYLEKAVELKDDSLCAQITDPILKQGCS